jgi:hypothetical protein
LNTVGSLHWLVGAIITVALLDAAACDAARVTENAVLPTLAPESSRTTPEASLSSTADPFVDLANAFPGFGGSFHYPGETTIFVYLTDPTIDLDPLKRAILYKFYPSNVDPDGIEIVALQGRYDWRQLQEWYEYSRDLWPLGINSSDIQESEKRLEFGASDEDAVAAITQAFLARGVPADAFEVHVEAPFTVD